MATVLITSRDEEGVYAVGLFDTTYNEAKLDKGRARLLNEKGGEFQAGILKLINELTMFNRYDNEEVSSRCTYPSEYKGPKLIVDQVKAIAEIFGLDPSQAFEFAKNLPVLPEGAEGWFAIPSVDALAARVCPDITDLAEKYCRVVMLIHKKLGSSRKFQNYRNGQIDKRHLQMHARTAHAMALIQEQQKGDILIIAAQLGMRHRGKSTRRAREVFVANEYGLNSLMGCAIALTHPERFVRSDELGMDLPGDEFAPNGDGRFVGAPILHCIDGRFGFGTTGGGSYGALYGSASGFLSQ